MATEVQILTDAPIQLGNLITFELRFVDQDGNAIDISTGTDLLIKFEDPTPVSSSIAAAFKTDGSDGWIVGTFAPNKFGDWRIQGRATIAAVEKHTGRGTFSVEPNLP